MNIDLIGKRLRCAIVACIALLPGYGWGAISVAGSSVQPASITIPLGQPTTITVTWVVNSSPPPGLTYNVSSSFGQFLAVGKAIPPLATVNTVLNSAVNTQVGVPGTAIITETVAVPAEVSVRANKAGAYSIIYVRTFSDGSATTGSLQANVIVGGSGMASFGVSRVALTFNDGAVVRVVPAKSALGAVADVTYAGSGVLRGYWEVADPGSTSGTPFFRLLQAISQGVGGTGRATLKSPALPTDILGLHMVRLRLTDPAPAFDPPVLYYYVGEARPGMPLSFTPMTVLNPPDHAYLDSRTQFSWQPVKDARVYKIEIFANPDTSANALPDLGGAPASSDPLLIQRALSLPAMAGMLVVAPRTQTTLSAFTRAKLQPRRSYFWRVQTIGRDGALLGEAQVRELRVP